MEQATLESALREAVDAKMGRTLVLPSDFELLSERVEEATGETLAVSTIKRLYGYVANTHAFTHRTLSVLARFVGSQDWTDFCRQVELRQQSDSGFMAEKQVQSSQLLRGNVVEAAWQPDRLCRFRYLGNNTYQVELSHNAKLNEGDTFHALLFAEGQPLYASDLRSADGTPHTYVAGKQHGLTSVKVLRF